MKKRRLVFIYFTLQLPLAHPTEPVLVLQSNPVHVAAAVLAKQSLPVEQHATTVVCGVAVTDAYDGVHVAGEHAYVFTGVFVAVTAG